MVMAWLTWRPHWRWTHSVCYSDDDSGNKKTWVKDVTCKHAFNWTFFFSWRSSGCCRSTTALDRWSSCCSRWWVVTRLSHSLTLNPSSSWRPYRITRLAIANIVYLSTFTAPCQTCLKCCQIIGWRHHLWEILGPPLIYSHVSFKNCVGDFGITKWVNKTSSLH